MGLVVFPRNGGSRNSPGGGMGPEGHAFGTKGSPAASTDETLYIRDSNWWVRFKPNSVYRLLKWPHSLYRPALPKENGAKAPVRLQPALFGRSQGVRPGS